MEWPGWQACPWGVFSATSSWRCKAQRWTHCEAARCSNLLATHQLWPCLVRRETSKTHRILKKTNRQQQHNNSELILFSIPSIPSGNGRRHTSRELIHPKRTGPERRQHHLKQNNCKNDRLTSRCFVDKIRLFLTPLTKDWSILKCSFVANPWLYQGNGRIHVEQFLLG